MSVACELCGRTWPRDPVLEVACPVCGAGVGHPCVSEAPSGHRKSAAFQGLPPWGHDERDLAAALAGAYGPCPEGRCGLEVAAERAGITVEELAKRKLAECGKRRRRPERAQDLELPLWDGAS